ncbi:hypothetical protein DICA3_E22606 [Diutina catenulata]
MSDDFKWAAQVRTLPTKTNDFLKVDYIDYNLNNSRKLIGNINHLGDVSEYAVQENEKATDGLMPLSAVRQELEWLKPL